MISLLWQTAFCVCRWHNCVIATPCICNVCDKAHVLADDGKLRMCVLLNAVVAFSQCLCMHLCMPVWFSMCVCVRVWYVSLATGAERCWHCLQRDDVQENEFIYPSLCSFYTQTHTETQTDKQNSHTADTHPYADQQARKQTNKHACAHTRTHTHLGGVWDLRHLAKVNRGNCQPWHFFGVERGFSRWQLSLGVSGRCGLVAA